MSSSSEHLAAYPHDSLAAAHLLLRAARAGVALSRPFGRTIDGAPELRYRADPPSALTPELRAEIAAHRPAILDLLQPWTLPLCSRGPVAHAARLVAREDPAWTHGGGVGHCAACGRATVLVSPEGVPMHPECDPLLGVL